MVSSTTHNQGSVLQSQNDDAVLSKVWRHIDLRIVPMMALLQFLSVIDNSNLGNARIAGLQDDLKFNNAQFGTLVVVTTVPYILVLIPVNFALKVIGPNILLPIMLTLWAIVTSLEGLARNYSAILACRFFLGMFEGGLFSAIVIYLSMWYPRQQLQKRVSAFISMGLIPSSFSGIFAYGIIRLDGIAGHPGWAWIFIIEGLFSVVCGIVLFFILPRSPAHARFLKTQEKEYVIAHLRQSGTMDANEDEAHASPFQPREFLKAISGPHVWMGTIMAFLMGATIFALLFFTPFIVAGLGYTNTDAQLYSAYPSVVAAVLAMITAYISDRYGARGVIIICSNLLAVIGLVVFLAVKQLHIKYMALFLVTSGSLSASPAITTWVANNSSPYLRRVSATAISSIAFQLGGVISSLLFGAFNLNTLTISLLAFEVTILIVAAMNVLYLMNENRKKKLERERLTHEGLQEERGSGDRSAWYEYNL